MFNRRTHRAIGTVAGAGYALAKANQQAPQHVLLEVFGGALTGNVGARLPDVHRARCVHSSQSPTARVR